MPQPYRPSVELRQPGIAREAFLFGFRIAAVVSRDHPVGAALEHVKLLNRGRDLRDELDRARGVADHGHVFSAQLHIMPPPRRMERDTAETRYPVDLWSERAVQLSDAADEDVGHDLFIARRAQTPYTFRVIPSRFRYFRVEAQMRQQVVLARAMLHVVEDLGLRSPLSRPVCLLLEGEAVREGRYVAACARISVVAPGSADPVRFFKDGK